MPSIGQIDTSLISGGQGSNVLDYVEQGNRIKQQNIVQGQERQDQEEQRLLSKIASDSVGQDGQLDYNKFSGNIAANPNISGRTKLDTIEKAQPLAKQQAMTRALSSYNGNLQDLFKQNKNTGILPDLIKYTQENMDFFNEHQKERDAYYTDLAAKAAAAKTPEEQADIINSGRFAASNRWNPVTVRGDFPQSMTNEQWIAQHQKALTPEEKNAQATQQQTAVRDFETQRHNRAMELIDDYKAKHPASFLTNATNTPTTDDIGYLGGQLATGDITPKELYSLTQARAGGGIVRTHALREAQAQYAESHPGERPLSFAMLDGWDKNFNSAPNQQARGMVTTFMSSLDLYTNLVNQLPQGSKLKDLDKILQSGQYAFGGKTITDVKTLQAILGSEFQASLTGSRSESDQRAQTAMNALNPAMDKDAAIEKFNLIRDREQNRIVNNALQGGIYGENWLKYTYGDDQAKTMIDRVKEENKMIAGRVARGDQGASGTKTPRDGETTPEKFTFKPEVIALAKKAINDPNASEEHKAKARDILAKAGE
jgi:hypothetical protein